MKGIGTRLLVVGVVALLLAGGMFGYAATLTVDYKITQWQVLELNARLENRANARLGRSADAKAPVHPEVIAGRWKLASYIFGGAGALFLVTGWAVMGASPGNQPDEEDQQDQGQTP